MDITEVRIKLMEIPGDRLRAFCSITFDDCFVIRDLKVIDGTSGPFVAMPSRKLTSHCAQCGCKNHLRASYCNQCGQRLAEDQASRDDEGRLKLYADIAHPINSDCRELIQDRVLSAYEEEVELAQSPDYRSRYDDFFDAGEEGDDYAEEPKAAKPTEPLSSPPETSGRTVIDSADTSGPKAPHQRPGKSRSAESVRRPPEFGEGIFDD